MAKLKPRKVPAALTLIAKRRKQCLAHRFIYYVLGQSLITDYQYDQWERELKALVAKYPDLARQDGLHAFCPSTHVGSSNLEDYPRSIEGLALSLVAYAGRAK